MGKKFLCLLLAVALISGNGYTADSAKKAALSFSKVTLKIGQKKKIVIKNKNKKAKYSYKSSSAKKIAVNKKGVITAKKAGKAKITVRETIKKKVRKVGVIKVTCKNSTDTDNAANQTPADETPKTPDNYVPSPTPLKQQESPEPTENAPTESPVVKPTTPAWIEAGYTTKVMSVTVNDKDLYSVHGSTCDVDMQYFEGSVSGDYFNGDISGQGTNVTKTYKEGDKVKYCARYIVKGTDEAGNNCNIFIEDNGTKEDSGDLAGKPIIITDSKELAWIETADIMSRVTDNGDGEKVIDILWNESNTEPVEPPEVVRPDESKSYTRELFTFMIDIGASEEVHGNTANTSMIHFGGRGKCDNFTGEVVADSVDTRIQFNGQVQTLSARYILNGTDAKGNPCNVYVENNGIDDNGMVTEPIIITDCPDYAWIETAPLHGTVSWSPQLTIHMWTTEE